MNKNITRSLPWAIKLILSAILLFSYGQLAAQTYCNGTSNCSTYGDYIESFSTSGGLANITNNNTLCANNAGTGYSAYLAMNHLASPGDIVNFSFTTNPNYQHFFKIWVDYDDDGVFTAAEEVYASPGLLNLATTYNGSFTIPPGNPLVSTRLRIRSTDNSDILTNVMEPCDDYSYGETEDYTFIIQAPPVNCTSTPVPGTISATQANGCLPYLTTLSLVGATGIGGGVTYLWQSGPSAFGPWTNLGNSITQDANIFTNTYFQCVLTCTNTNQTDITPAFLCSISPHAVATLPFSESFESWQDFCETSDIPTATYWGNNPATGDNSWRRDDEGYTANWTYAGGDYFPAFTVGAHSARFDTYSANTGMQGSLDLYVDFSAAADKDIQFDYINTGGTDVLDVLISTDGGNSFNLLGTYYNTGGWETNSLTTSAVANPAILRFRGTSDFGTDDIGLDNVTIIPACTPPVITTLAFTDPTTCNGGDGTITVNGTSLSGDYTITYTSSVGGTITTGAITASGSALTITGLSPATYTDFSITAVGAPCSSNTLSGPVNINDPIPPSITASLVDPTTCGGSQGTITISGLLASTAYDFYYNNNPAQTITSTASGTYVLTGLSAGTYNDIYVVRINCTSNVLGPLVLADPAKPVINNITRTNPTTCGGSNGTIVLNVDSAGSPVNGVCSVTYTAPSGTVTASFTAVNGVITITGLIQGAYTNFSVTATWYSCTSVTVPGPVTLTDPLPPFISNANTTPTTTCFGSDGTIRLFGLLANTTYTLSYTDSGNIITNSVTSAATGTITITGLSAGAYTNIYVVRNNCTSNVVGPLVVIDPISPTLSAGSNSPVCQGDSLNFSSEILVNGNPVIADSYNWTGPAFAIPVDDPAPSIPNATIAATGIYTVTAVVNGCVTPPVNVSVLVDSTHPPLPDASANTPVCAGSPLLFTVNNFSPGYTYSWTGPNGYISQFVNPTISYAQLSDAGDYIVAAATFAGCRSYDTIHVVVNDSATAQTIVTVSPGDTACLGDNIVFTAHVVNGGTDPMYQWVKNGAWVLGATDSFYGSPYLYSFDTIYCILTSTQACVLNPVDTSNKIMITLATQIAPSVVLTAAPAVVLPGQPITFTATYINAGPNPTFEWFKNGILIPGATSSTYTTVNVFNSDLITVVVHSSFSCAVVDTASASWGDGVVTVSTASVTKGNVISMYPNPNNGMFTVDGLFDGMADDRNVKTEVLNALGQVIFKGTTAIINGKLHTQVQLGRVAAGMYVFRMQIGDNMEQLRFSISE